MKLVLFYWYVWALLGAYFIYEFVRPRIRGFFGEKTVSMILSTLDPSKYRVINNLMLKSGAATIQIDHVVVSDHGIFVIETRNYKGLIFGDEHQEQWTQVINKFKTRFENPVRQNYGHIQTIKQTLGNYPDSIYFSIIAFTTKSTLRVNADSADVVHTTRLLKAIKDHDTEIITNGIRDEIYNALVSDNINKRPERKKHIEYIHNVQNEIKTKVRSGVCPKCNGKLVSRKGKYGPFIGCSNFPRCRYMAKSTNANAEMNANTRYKAKLMSNRN